MHGVHIIITDFVNIVNLVLALQSFVAKFALFEVICNLHTTLNGGATHSIVNTACLARREGHALDILKGLLQLIREVIELRRLGE